MYRMYRILPRVATACVLALTLAACNGSPSAPSRSEAAGGATEAGPNGETLKVQAPSLSAPANDLRLDSRKPTLVATNVAGKFVGGTYSYEFELLTDGNSRVAGVTLPSGSGTTTWAYPTDLERDTPYRWRVRARMGNAVGPWSATGRFLTLFEKRTPDPAPGTRLPAPNMSHIVFQIAAQFPNALRNSCQPDGGSWEFMDRLVDALRLEDTRWGYNWKRGNVGDPSLDVVVYNYTAQPDEGNPNVWAFETSSVGHIAARAARRRMDWSATSAENTAAPDAGLAPAAAAGRTRDSYGAGPTRKPQRIRHRHHRRTLHPRAIRWPTDGAVARTRRGPPGRW